MDDCEVQRMACVWVDAMAGEMVSNEAARSVEKMADELASDSVEQWGHKAASSKVE